jgi:hypothetical protein
MKNSDFQKLIKKDKYQIFLFTCPCSMPISFASHNWFVINKKGEVSRWEVAHKKWEIKDRWGYLCKNLLQPTQGTEVVYTFKRWHYNSKLLGCIEGDENSVAKRAVDFIENSRETYQFKDTYHFIGTNSNTYIQWVLNNFPEIKIKLPLNAFGKGII